MLCTAFKPTEHSTGNSSPRGVSEGYEPCSRSRDPYDGLYGADYDDM